MSEVNIPEALSQYWHATRESYANYVPTKKDGLDCIEYHPPFFDTPAERFFRQKPGLRPREHLPAPLHVTRSGPQEYVVKKLPEAIEVVSCDYPIAGLEKIADSVIRDEVVGEIFLCDHTLFRLDRLGITVSAVYRYPPIGNSNESLRAVSIHIP